MPTRDESGALGATGAEARKPRDRPEIWIPLLYAVVSGAWIAFSDLVVAGLTRSIGEHAAWSTLKGFGFVTVTALLLHAWLRRALARERGTRRRLEESEALEDQLAKIAASVPGLICSFRLRPDGSACMPFTTPAAEDLYGLTQEELARDFALVAANMYPDDLPRVMANIREAARTMARWHDAFRYHHPAKGLRWIEGWSLPKPEADGSILWHGYVQDVTEPRRLEEQLQQAQKLDSIGRLAGGVAHDFNNLLTVILSCTESLREALRRGERASAEEVSEIQGAAERARDLTRQLLAVARRQPIQPVTLDLNVVVRGSERLLRRVLGEDVELVVRLEANPWPIRGDAGQLEQVILNLALNARDAMPAGGTLSIETRNSQDETAADGLGEAACPDRASGPWVCLAVRDSGSGMTDEVKGHLFEPFFTTKQGGQGTGLGLATVYGIVAQNDGCIQVESEPGRGSVFTIRFPRAEGAPTPALASPPLRVVGGAETVLVVEDDPHVREVTVRSLAAGGFRVIAAADGREALALDEERLSAVDLLVTDVVMPGLDGSRVADELRRRRPGLRVLYVSGYTPDAVAAHGVIDSGVDLLAKPFTPSTLLARVRAALDAPEARPGGLPTPAP